MPEDRDRDLMIERIDERVDNMRQRIASDFPKITEAIDRLTRFGGRLDSIERDVQNLQYRMREYERERDQEMELVTRLQTETILPMKAEMREAALLATTRWKILAALVGFGSSIIGALLVLLLEHFVSKILP